MSKNITNDKIISELLQANILTCDFLRYTYHSDDVFGKTICLFVDCKDLFVFGAENSEDVDSEEELKNLYNSWVNDKSYGVDIWCCKHRNMQPQRVIKDIWKKNGIWSDELDSLMANPNLDK